jgi:SAM-dependent methyltransferase
MYKLPQSAREFVLFQRTELLPKRRVSLIARILQRTPFGKNNYNEWIKSIACNSDYDIETSYFSDMEKLASKIALHLPPQVKSILDIGCGIAALDIFLDKLVSPEKIFLLDKTHTEQKVWYMFEEKGAFYNSLDLARETLVLNGVSPSKVELVTAPNDGLIPLDADSIDVIISTISWGFHYPIKFYIESVHKLLRSDGILIVDIRKDSGGFDELGKLFEVTVIDDYSKFQRVKCIKKIL